MQKRAYIETISSMSYLKVTFKSLHQQVEVKNVILETLFAIFKPTVVRAEIS